MALTGHERIAARNIKGAFNWEFGGIYNAFQDGEEITLTLNQMKDLVYDAAMDADYRVAGSCGSGRAPKEMRFAGTEFCRNYIDKLFAKDPDVKEIPWVEEAEETTEEIITEENTQEDTEMENKKDMLNSMTVKELRAEAKAQGIEGMSRAKKEELIAALMFHNYGQPDPELTIEISKVHMYAFTGMYIGEFDAEVRDGNIIVNTTSKGELVFDISTGKEITTAAKARYANRVERA